MDLLDTLHISASGLSAQRLRLKTIASNMANAKSTRGPDGSEPYRRKLAVFETKPVGSFDDELDRELSRVQVSQITESKAPFKKVFDPSHPDSDDDGYVLYPNVDILNEMVDMMNTSRSYEANTNVVETTYQMAMKALEIGR
jgi:flagellar basal-body rod protein FlgC